MHGGRVYTHTAERGNVAVVEVGGDPGGLGWTPDGRLLVVSMKDRRLLRVDSGRVHEVADLATLSPFPLNDMLVDTRGRAYIGTFGFAPFDGDERGPGAILAVDPDAKYYVAAEDLEFPNGMVLTDSGRTLVVAESFGERLTAFTRRNDRTLTDRRVWATLPIGVMPDGIDVDAEGSIWVASVTTYECLLVRAGGDVLRRIDTGAHMAIDCALGGDDGRTLFIALNRQLVPRRTTERRAGRIATVTVEVGAPLTPASAP
jgi:sugar lactone lactonase YvrE